MVSKKLSSYIRRWQFHKYVVFQWRLFYKPVFIYYGQWRSYAETVIVYSHFANFLPHAWYLFSFVFFFLVAYGRHSVHLSLSRLGRCHWFGGAAATPPLEAPHEGIALEATAWGGGLIVATVVLRPQICCLTALSRQGSLCRWKLSIHRVTEGNGRREHWHVKIYNKERIVGALNKVGIATHNK